MSSAKRVARPGRASYSRFAGFPFDVLKSKNYSLLSAYGKALLIDLRMQYNGYNNGDLDCTWSRMSKQRCWRSKETLNHAIQELVYYGFIVRTRKGKRVGGTHYPSLYAITWESIDDVPKQGVRATRMASGEWRTARERWEPPKRQRRQENKPQERLAHLPSTRRVIGQVRQAN